MKAFLLFLVCLTSSVTLARELTDMSIEVVTDKQGNEAKQEAFDKAIEQATERLTQELLGPERIGSQFRWSFATQAGQTYDVEYKDDLNTTNWQVLQTISGDGTVKSFTVSATGAARFYRVARR